MNWIDDNGTSLENHHPEFAVIMHGELPDLSDMPMRRNMFIATASDARGVLYLAQKKWGDLGIANCIIYWRLRAGMQWPVARETRI